MLVTNHADTNLVGVESVQKGVDRDEDRIMNIIHRDVEFLFHTNTSFRHTVSSNLEYNTMYNEDEDQDCQLSIVDVLPDDAGL